MAKNKLTDLNNHLFAQLERLGDENIESDAMDLEIKKAKAVSQIAGQIIKSASVTLSAAKMISGGEFTEDVSIDMKTKLLG